MEKICIVRRRKRDIHGVGADGIAAEEMTSAQDVGVVLSQAVRDDIDISPDGDVSGDKTGTMSVKLTTEQCGTLIRSGRLSRYMSSGMTHSATFGVQQQDDGQISLNFYFDQGKRLRMLKAKQVCEMLQISRSFLGTLVKTERLKSYKIGGLRRFAMEDILEFLAGNEGLHNIEEMV